MTIINSGTGFFIGRKFDVQLSAELRHKGDLIFERTFKGNDLSVVDTTNNRLFLNNHFFKTGEKLEYQFPNFENATESNSNAIGIATTSIINVGVSSRVPRTVFAVVLDDQFIQLAQTKEEALRREPKVLNFTNAGIGASHRLIGEKQNTRSLITVDNVIQTPSIDTEIKTTLLEDFSGASDFLLAVGITSFFTGDLIRIGKELMKIELIGAGNTTSMIVRRPILGTGLEDHLAGDEIVKQTGAYQIVGSTIYFPVPPFDKSPTTDLERRDPEDRDYVGLETFSSFNGRVFLRSGFEDTEIGPYDNNFLLDDISNQFLGISTQAILKEKGQNISGFSTGGALVLINNVFQTPDFIDYGLGESSGITTISFTGSKNSNLEDINTASIPRGGIIISVGTNEAYGYQPLVSAGGTANVSGIGTISNISIGYTGSGYRAPEKLVLPTRITYPTFSDSGEFFLEDTEGLFKKLKLLLTGKKSKCLLSVENSVGITNENKNEYTLITSIGAGNSSVIIGNPTDAWDEIEDFSSYRFFADTTVTQSSGIATDIIKVADIAGISTDIGEPTYYLSLTSVANNIEIIGVDDTFKEIKLDQLTDAGFVDNSTVTYSTFRAGITSTRVGDNAIITVTEPNLGLVNIYVNAIKESIATQADYTHQTGIVTITAPGLSVNEGDIVDLRDFIYKCNSGGSLFGSDGGSSNFRVGINSITSNAVSFSVLSAEYDPVSGIATINVGVATGYSSGDKFFIEPESLGFSCTLDANETVSYYPGPNDANYNTQYEIIETTASTFVVDVGQAGSNTSEHTFERISPSSLSNPLEVSTATYDSASGLSTITFTSSHGLVPSDSYDALYVEYTSAGVNAGLTTIAITDTSHPLQIGDKILLSQDSLGFTCDLGPQVTYYPRSTDPLADTFATITSIGATTIEFNAGANGGGTHVFVGVNTNTPKPIKVKNGDYIFLKEEGLTFSCTYSGGGTGSYPRAVGGDGQPDYAYNRLLEVLETPTANQIVVYTGFTEDPTFHAPHTFVSADTDAVRASTGQARYSSGIVTFTTDSDVDNTLVTGNLVLFKETGTLLDDNIFTVTESPFTFNGSINAFSIDTNELNLPSPLTDLNSSGDFVLATISLPSPGYGNEYEILEKLSDNQFMVNVGTTKRRHIYVGGGKVKNLTRSIEPIHIGISTINDGHITEPIITNVGSGFTQFNLFKRLNVVDGYTSGSTELNVADVSGIDTYKDYVTFPESGIPEYRSRILDIDEDNKVLTLDQTIAFNIAQNVKVDILRFDEYDLDIDDPLSYNNLDLIYSNESVPGIGSYAKCDIVIGNDGKLEAFELTRSGYSYGQGEILTVRTGGVTGIPTFSDINVTGISTAIGIFTGSIATLNDRFGFRVATNEDGTRIAVGAPYDELDESETESGVVYMFDRVGDTFTQVGILTGEFASNQDDNFGYSVAMNADGSRIVVGSPLDENPVSGIQSGQAYVFDRTPGPTFTQVGILSATFGQGEDRHGWSVDISSDGEVIIVGAYQDEFPGSSTSSGIVYVYDGSNLDFPLVGIITGSLSDDIADFFGYSCAISPDGGYIAVGALFDEDTNVPSDNFGVAYVYTKVGVGIAQVGILTSPRLSSTKANDYFGYSIDISNNGNIVAVGAIDDASGISGNITGRVYIYEKINNEYYFIQTLTGEFANDNGDRFGESISISDDGRIIAIGAMNDENTLTENESGITYLFERRTQNYLGADYIQVGVQTGTYSYSLTDNFGVSVALSNNGNNLIVGAQYDSYNDVGIGTSGVVYAYDLLSGNIFDEFQVLIDQTFTDDFAGYVFGDLVVFDDISRLFNGKRVEFPIRLRGIQTTLRSRQGSNLDINYNLIIFVNDIYQVPKESYVFDGGSILTFTEPPKQGDKCVIVFYFGTTEVDTRTVDILETIKIGDIVTVNSDNFSLQQDPRTVTDVRSTDIIETNTYVSPGLTLDESLKRPITWCKQLVDKVIDGNVVGKSRIPYEAEIYPKTKIIKSVGVGTTENQIFLESVRTFFDSNDEYENIGVNKRPQYDVILIDSDRVAIAASATVSVNPNNLRLNNITLNYGGLGYSQVPDVSISAPNFAGIGTTSNVTAKASATIKNGRVVSVTLDDVGYGYTTTGFSPKVLISPPKTRYEFIDDVVYNGDFGVITGVGTTSVTREPISEVGFTTSFHATGAEQFGYRVSVDRSGSSFIIGSPFDEFVGSDATGLAYVFDYDRNTETITGITTLSPSYGGGVNENYGWAVSVSGDGNIFAVSAPGDEIVGIDSGILYVYERVGNNFNELNAFEPTTPGAGPRMLAESIDISDNGSIIVAGAANDDAGRVYLYEREGVGVGNTFLSLTTIVGSNAESGDRYGQSVALNANGSRLVVGSPGENSIYIYNRTDSTTYRESKIITDPNSNDNEFGLDVDISSDGNTIVVTEGVLGSQYVYIYKFDNINFKWVLYQTILLDEETLGNRISVSITDNSRTIVVGYSDATVSGVTQAGKTLVYTQNGNSYTNVGILTGSESTTSSSLFGWDSVISGNGEVIIIGSPRSEIPGNPADSGVSYVFKNPTPNVFEKNIVFELYIPEDSYLRKQFVGDPRSESQIQKNYYFKVSESNLGLVGYGITGLNLYDGSSTFNGSQNLDSIYQVSNVSIARTEVYSLDPARVGTSRTDVVRVTVPVLDWNGIDIPSGGVAGEVGGPVGFGYTYNNYFGNYSWGLIFDFKRGGRTTFELYKDGDSGLSTSPDMLRVNPLKYEQYTPNPTE